MHKINFPCTKAMEKYHSVAGWRTPFGGRQGKQQRHAIKSVIPELLAVESFWKLKQHYKRWEMSGKPVSNGMLEPACTSEVVVKHSHGWYFNYVHLKFNIFYDRKKLINTECISLRNYLSAFCYHLGSWGCSASCIWMMQHYNDAAA